MPTNQPRRPAPYTDELLEELAQMFLEERGVGEEAAEEYADQVLRQDRKMRKWLVGVGVRANGVEAVYLNVSLSQYESLKIHSGDYSPKDTSRIPEDLRTRPADFVAERDDEWAWLHPRVRWVSQ